MVGWLFRATLSLIILGVVAYTAIAVPIGRRTLLEHALNIARTAPAKELAEDVGTATSGAIDRARAALQ